MANPLNNIPQSPVGNVATPNVNSLVANNPLAQMLAGNANPQQLLMQQVMQSNPLAQQAMQLVQGKNPQQVEQMVRQLAQQKGMDLNQLSQQANQLMQQFGKK